MTTDFGTVPLRGVPVSIGRLGFGCARLFGGAEARASARLIEAALECGFRHFDTAPNYAYGLSEQSLGDILAGMPGVTITTKVGIEPSGTPSRASTLYRLYARPALSRAPALKKMLLKRYQPAAQQESERPVRRRLGREDIRASVERSLKKLKRDRIDLLLLHEPDQFLVDKELRGHFKELVREGLIAAYGLGYDRTATDAPALGQALQGRYSLESAGESADMRTRIFHGVLRRRASEEISPAAAIRAVLNRHPDAAVVVSASTQRQIQDLTSASA